MANQNSRLFKDVERKFGRKSVAPQLKSGAGVVLDVRGGLFGFQKKFPCAANEETIVGRLGCFADLDGVLVDDVLVGFGVAPLVIHVPAERFEKRVEKFTAKLGFVVLRRAAGLDLPLEAGDEFVDFLRSAHFERAE
jgi:hypothetical protein